ncbi:MAG: hypothetical protein HQ503_06410 [Rhodospirillales bacterium]|nr:hypothetical protein [Rhodospirillales bacterium]
MWAVLFIIVVIIFPESVIVMVVGLLPSIVALIVDQTLKKYAFFCVLGMNVPGVFPSLLDLWGGSNDLTGAIKIITNVFDLTIMYAAAGFGWLLYVSIPPVIGAFITVTAQQRVSTLRARQREIINEWGKDIATSGTSATDGSDNKNDGDENETGEDAAPA